MLTERGGRLECPRPRGGVRSAARRLTTPRPGASPAVPPGGAASDSRLTVAGLVRRSRCPRTIWPPRPSAPCSAPTAKRRGDRRAPAAPAIAAAPSRAPPRDARRGRQAMKSPSPREGAALTHGPLVLPGALGRGRRSARAFRISRAAKRAPARRRASPWSSSRGASRPSRRRSLCRVIRSRGSIRTPTCPRARGARRTRPAHRTASI